MQAVTEAVARAWTALRGAQPEWIGVAFLLYCLAWMAASGRWRLIVRALGGRLGWTMAGLAVIAGVCVNNITPTGRLGGEACRIAITRLKGQLSVSRGALATLCDRLTDLPAVAAMGLVALPALPSMAGGHSAILVIAAALVAAMAVVFGRSVRAIARSWLTGWTREGVSVGMSAILAALACSGLVWVEDLLRIMAVALAFDVALPVPQAAALVVVGVFGGFVPTVGGLGAVEGALVGTLVLFGVPLETAIAITTVERAISYGFSTLLGGVVVVAMGGRRLWRPER